MLATNRYADVDAQLDTRLLEGFPKDNDAGEFEYYDDEEEEEEDGGSVEPREVAAEGSVAKNSVGKDNSDFGEAMRSDLPAWLIYSRGMICTRRFLI